MRKLNLIRVYSDNDDEEDITYLGKRFKEQRPSGGGSTMEICLEDETEELNEFLGYIEKKNMKHFLTRGFLRFTEEELKQIPYFKMTPGWIQDFKAGCEDYGTKVIYEQCENCKSGEVQLTPATFPVAEVKKRSNLFFLFPALIISSKLKKILEDMDATGCTFQEIIDTETGKVDSNFYQFIFDTQLPPVSSRIRQTGKCNVCGQNLIDYEGTMQYKAADFSEKKDFYIASESIHPLYGLGPYRHHIFIVSSRMKDVLYNNSESISLPVYIQGMFEGGI